MAASISPISTPTINWAARNLSLEYTNYEEMCALMFDGPLAEHKDNDKAKFSYMSLWGGPKALELFRNSALCNQKTSKNLLLVLKDYCKPSNNTFWSSRMEMRNLSQRDNESFSDFSNRTCSISNDCDWKDRDEQIVCSLIFGARHKEAQRKALLKPKDFSVKSCVEHFTSFEINDKQQNAIKSGAINVIDYKPKHKQQNCWFCGNIHPRKSCPAYGHECKKCGRTNHFERCCINKSGKEAKTSSQKSHKKSKGDREQYQTSKKQYGKHKNNKKVFHVNEHSDESSNEDFFCLEVNQHIDEPCELSYNQGTFSDELVYYLDTADQGDTNSKVCDKDGIANSDIVDHSANNSYGNINIVSSSSLNSELRILFNIIHVNNYTFIPIQLYYLIL